MRNDKYFVAVLGSLLISIFLLLECKKKPEPEGIVARIDGFEITTTDFTNQFKIKYPNVPLTEATPQSKQKVLDEMVRQQLILMEAYRLGYDKDPEMINQLNEKEAELAAQEWVYLAVGQQPINNPLLREYYQLMQKRFDLFHIRLNIDTPDKEEVVKTKAKEIHRRLLKGEDFRKLAATFSEHETAANDSGKIGNLDCFGLPKPLIAKLHAMKEGEISEPIQTDDAIYLLKLEKIYPQKLADFDIVRTEIYEELEKMQQHATTQKLLKLEMGLRKKYHFTLLPENIDFFCERTKKMKSRSDTLGLFSTAEKRKNLSKTDLFVITIGDFFPKVLEHYWDSLYQRRVVEMLLEHMASKRLLKRQALLDKVNETPKVREQFDTWKAHLLKQYVIEKEVLGKARLSDDELRQYYEEIKNSFRVPTQVMVQEIFCRTQEEIDHVYRLAMAGKDFAQLQKQYSQDQETRTNGVLGPFRKGEHGQLGVTAFSGMRVGDISKPFRYRGGYSLIKLLSYEPERIEPFENVRERVETQYLEKHKERLVNDWLTAVQKNHQIQLVKLP